MCGLGAQNSTRRLPFRDPLPFDTWSGVLGLLGIGGSEVTCCEASCIICVVSVGGAALGEQWLLRRREFGELQSLLSNQVCLALLLEAGDHGVGFLPLGFMPFDHFPQGSRGLP